MASKFLLTARLSLLPPLQAELDQTAAAIQRKLGTVVIPLSLRASQTDLKQIRNLQREINRLNKEAASAASQVQGIGSRKVSNDIRNVAKATDEASSNMEALGKSSALALRRFAGFVVATFAIRGLIRTLEQGVGNAIEFDRALVKIAQVTGSTVTGVKNLREEVNALSTSLGVDSAKLINVSRILAQTGLSANDTRVALTALAKTELSPTFENIESTAEGAIAILAQFNLEADQLDQKLGSLAAVSGNFAVESSDLISAVKRAGGAFSAAGGSLEELIALFTSVRSTTRESADSIAVGFRTIFTRLQRVRTINFLETLGIQLRDAEGAFIGPLKAVEELNKALAGIESTDPRFAQITEELGGFRQVSKVIPLLQQYEKTQKALLVAQSAGNILTDDAASAQEALAIQIQKVQEEFKLLVRNVFENPRIRFFINQVLELTSAFVQLANTLIPLIPVLTVGFGAVIGRGAIQFLQEPKTGKGFLGNLFPQFQTGGTVPGTGTGDKIPALLEPGEFVIRRKNARALGTPLLQKLNSDRVQRFQTGGLVGRVGPAGAAVGGAVAIGLLNQFTSDLDQADSALRKWTQTLGGGLLQFAIFFSLLKAGNVLLSERNQLEQKRNLVSSLERSNTERQRNLNNSKRNLRLERERAAALNRQIFSRGETPEQANILAREFDEPALGTPKDVAQQKQILAGIASRREKIAKEQQAIADLRFKAFAEGDAPLGDPKASARRTSLLESIGKRRQNVSNLRGEISDLRLQSLQVKAPIPKDASNRLAGLQEEAKVRKENIQNLEAQNKKIANGIDIRSRTIAAEKKAAQAIEDNIARQERTLLITTAVAAAATQLGEALKASAFEAIEAGRSQSALAASLAGGLSGAGQGVLIGSFISQTFKSINPVIGSLAGAIIAGTIGLVTSFKKAREAIETVKFETSFEAFTSSLDSVTDGSVAAITQIERVNAGLASLDDRAITASADGLKQLRGQIQDLVPRLQDFLTEVAKSARTVDEFVDIVGRDTLLRFSRITSKPLEDIIDSFETQIDINNKKNAIDRQAIRIQAEFASRSRAILSFTSSLNDAKIRFDALSNSLDLLSNSQIPNFSSILGSAGLGDNALFQREIARVTGSLGAGSDVLRDEALSAADAIRILPAILGQARNTSLLSGEGELERQIGDQLAKQIQGPGSATIIDSITGSIRKIIGSEGKPEKLVNELQNNFIGVLQNITNPLREVIQVLQDAAERINQAQNRFISNLDKIASVQQELFSLQLREVDLRTRIADFFADTNRVSQTDRLGNAAAADTARLNLFGGGPQALIGQLGPLAQQLATVQDQLARGNFNANQFQQLAQRRADLIAQLDKTKRGLEFLANGTATLAQAQKALQEQQDIANRKFKLAADFIFGDRNTRRDIASNIQAATAAGATGDLSFIPESRRAGLRSFLDQLSNVRLSIFGTNAQGQFRSGEELQRDIVRNELISANVNPILATQIAEAQSPTMNTLIQTISTEFQKSLDALNALQQDAKDRGNELTKINDQGFKNVVNEIRAASVRANLQRLQLDQQAVAGNIAATQANIGRFTQLQQLGFSQDPETLRKQVVAAQQIPRLGDLVEQNALLGRLFTDDFRARDVIDFDFQKREGKIPTFDLGTVVSSTQDLLDRLVDQGFNVTDIRSNILNELGSVFGDDLTGRVQASGLNVGRVTKILRDGLAPLKTQFVSSRAEEKQLRNKLQGLPSAAFDPRNRQQINTLINEIGTDDLPTLNKNLQQLGLEIQAINSQIRTLQQNAPGPPPAFALGGLVRGTGNDDSVHARLTPGEFVLRKDAVRQIGVDNLRRLNRGGGAVNTLNTAGFEAAVTNFGTSTTALTEAMNSFPREVTHEVGGKVEVVINGAEVLTRLQPVLQDMVTREVKNGIQKFINSKLPGLGQF